MVARQAIATANPTGHGQPCLVSHSQCESTVVYVCSHDGTGTTFNGVTANSNTAATVPGPPHPEHVRILRPGYRPLTQSLQWS